MKRFKLRNLIIIGFLEAKDLIQQCLRFDPLTRCTLEEVLRHKWTKTLTPDWLTLISSSTFNNENDENSFCLKETNNERLYNF